MFSRRDFIASAAALTMVGAARASAQAHQSPADALTAVMDRAYQRLVLDDPELRTSLGLDTGEHAAVKARLRDRSAARIERYHDEIRGILRALNAIDRSALSGTAAIDYDSLKFLYDVVVSGYDAFDYGTFSWPEPYSVSQLGGTYRSLPDFLANQHRIEGREDAEAYLARASSFARQLDHETDRIAAERALGVVPPVFVIDRTVALMDGMLATPAAENGLVRSLVERTRAIPGDWEARATGIVATEVLPALRRQRDACAAGRSAAPEGAGVWRLPRGDAYYAYALRYSTTTDLDADTIHFMGVEQLAELNARADAILRAQGMTQGSVGERLSALRTDARFIYPNDEAGKARLLAELNADMIRIQERLPDMFGRLPRARVEIRRVPVDIEAAATGGYYQPPALDGSRPGAYYINLRDTAETPKWSLTTLTAHEASPGHHHQIALAQEAQGVHPLRRLPTFSAYSEGWGLYAEQLADEMGIYSDNPFGRVGYLRSYMFRAARLVADTGLHHKRWTREQAIQFMVETLGEHPASATTEIERYCVWPGQATSYKVGQTRWLQLREEARRRLGDRFDIRGFHDTALAMGTVPLAVLERIVEDWIERT